MSAASTAGGDGGDGGEDEARKIEARKIEERKIKDAERSRKRRAEKKAKDEADSKKMKAMEVRMAEMEKSLESKDVEIAASKVSYQSMVAEIQRLVAENTVLRNLALKKNADQIIWDEGGDDQFVREKVLLDLEQECLEVYRRKVGSVNISRARRHPELAESKAEFTHLILSVSERSIPGWVMLHHLGIVLTILWSLMDSRYEDWPLFSHITSLLSFHQPRYPLLQSGLLI